MPPSSLVERQQSDPIAQVVMMIVDAMRTDFGERFTRQFADSEQARQLKRRLYEKLRNYVPQAIVDGYERLIGDKPGLLPTVPEIAEYAREADAVLRRKEQGLLDAERLAALPAPQRSARPGEVAGMLASAVDAAADKSDHEKWLDRKRAALIAQEQLLAAARSAGRIRMTSGMQAVGCAVPGCPLAGALSHDTRGGGVFYCAAHFRQ